MKQIIYLSFFVLVFSTSSCNKEYECMCEGNIVGVNGTWKENQVGYDIAKEGCEIYEECTWVEIN